VYVNLEITGREAMSAGNIIGFIIWVLVGGMFIGIGIHAFVSKEPVGFWANVEMFPVNDVKAYNRAMGKLWLAYALGLILLGLPLLAGANSPLIILSIVGVLLEAIAVMIVYMLVIKEKYERK